MCSSSCSPTLPNLAYFAQSAYFSAHARFVYVTHPVQFAQFYSRHFPILTILHTLLVRPILHMLFVSHMLFILHIMFTLHIPHMLLILFILLILLISPILPSCLFSHLANFAQQIFPRFSFSFFSFSSFRDLADPPHSVTLLLLLLNLHIMRISSLYKPSAHLSSFSSAISCLFFRLSSNFVCSASLLGPFPYSSSSSLSSPSLFLLIFFPFAYPHHLHSNFSDTFLSRPPCTPRQ